MSVVELLPLFGSAVPVGIVTVAVFTTVPVAVLETVAVTVTVTLLPFGKLAVVLTFPAPFGWPQVAPLAPTQVQVALINAAGKLSVMVAPFTAIGPLLVTTMVYDVG